MKDKPATLKKLYEKYKQGDIAECTYRGELAYSAGINAYDKTGAPIGDCNYGWGNVDPVCKQLKKCAVVY